MQFAVVGDLHLDATDPRFDRAHEQLREAGPQHVVCLGDFGCGKTSGTREAFAAGRAWLEGFGVPFEGVLGNHDLERTDLFASDAAAVRSYCEVMEREQPHAAFDLGPALGITLASTGFRSNRGYAHEVSIDEEQFRWFAATLESERERPVFVFSHAPPFGSRLRVLQHPHLRGGNAWLNQSNGPRRFHELLARHPQVRLWFSAHNHLGQDHPRALSHVGRCLFVHTGVIGAQSRDGRHQSRWVRVEDDAVTIESIDHDAGGARRRDAEFDLAANSLRRFDSNATPVHLPFFSAPHIDDLAENPWQATQGRSALLESRRMWLEFDHEIGDPIGVVCEGHEKAHPRFDGDELAIGRRKRLKPNEDGYYFTIPTPRRRLVGHARAALGAVLRRLRPGRRTEDADHPMTTADSR